ncbi:DUF1254 domain-containing protein [Nordella sp. HKS 07]|uniref:DUF1254 domain-containing protein n=1 Tax=Nordella sp. HKS 07 TaxID=2712222 RepID=UPI0013E180A9|nr:DUF1254 domain-containing protein [Nordella sp. HKS 07]QIG46798.1 DUF1254 domain-containing protein [Nordella sp. HKS 07]
MHDRDVSGQLIEEQPIMFNNRAGMLAGTLAQNADSETTVIETRFGALTFVDSLPTEETRQKLYDELDYQRAVQAILWAEPAINNALFRRAMDVAGVPDLGAMIYDKRMQPGQEALTPNQSVIYLYDRIDLSDDQPVIYVAPPGPINAGFFDMWMRPIHDFGIVGPNKGKGDKIVVLPPHYAGEMPAGYHPIQSKTNQLFTITRVFVNETMSEKQGTALVREIQTYRLSDAANPPAKSFVLMGDPAGGGKEFRMNRPTGLDYWRLLHQIVNDETLEERDRIPLGNLASIGIERGKPFAPDPRMEKILVDAERTGKAIMVNEAFSPRAIPEGIEKHFYPCTQWENVQLLPDMSQTGQNFDYVVNRMVAFYQANGAQLFWTPRDFPPGFGQKYLGAYKDDWGDWLKGEHSYLLRVPANVPVKDFWSVAVYDVGTRALIETPQHLAELNPKVQKLKTDADGSIDLCFGPTAPPGMETNWVQTIPGRAWFAYFRFYGPTEAFYDKSWQLPDVVKLD